MGSLRCLATHSFFVMWLAGVGCGSLATEAADAPSLRQADAAKAEVALDRDSAVAWALAETGVTVDLDRPENGGGGVDAGAGEHDAAAGELGLDADVVDVDASDPGPPTQVVVRALAEPWGEHCGRGGVKIESGVDLDGDGVLSVQEVAREEYVCNVYPVSVALGSRHSCAIASSGAVWCWGKDDVSQLGDYGDLPAQAPRPVAGVPAAVALAVGADTGCVILPTSGARCWGANDRGQGGHGVAFPFMSPSCVLGSEDGTSLLGVASLSVGGAHACAVLDDGTARCWGASDAGQLASGTGDSNVPVPVIGVAEAKFIVAGGRHTCALLDDTTVRCWGAGEQGQLGDGATSTRSSPVAVGDGTATLSGVQALAAGEAFTCALMQDGAVMCWGSNASCQLGQPSTIRTSAVPVLAAAKGIRSIAAGAEHVCAIDGDGKVSCWGRNDLGQAGASAGACRADPVVLPLQGVLSVGAGGAHSCAVNQTGVWCWGDDSSGQLGIGIASAERTTHVPQLALWPLAP
jgi:alpha-tubulin suppressor-like RCC1 family protein